MREIKFRAWDKNNKAMFNEVAISKNGKCAISQEDIFELMQYTGLKDKNGKEIYEGDIVNEKSIDKKYFTVIFKDGSFFFNDGDEYCPCKEWYINFKKIKIIGNIYKCSNLLK